MKRFVFLLLLLPLWLCCCNWEYTLTFDRETFERERRLWMEQDIQTYSFRFSYHDGYPGWVDNPTTLVVQDGLLRYVRQNHIPDAYFPANKIQDYQTINDLYAAIQEWADTKEKWMRESIDIRYDPTYHYPTVVSHNGEGNGIVFPPPDPGATNGYSFKIFIGEFNPDPEELWPENMSFFDRETFEREWQLWLEQDIQDYSFSFRHEDLFDYSASVSATVVIKGGALDSYGAGGVPGDHLESAEARAWALPLTAVFAKIAEEASKETEGGIRLIVQYDSERHYPRRLYYYYSAPDRKNDAAYYVSINLK